jgi:hypothetical protein
MTYGPLDVEEALVKSMSFALLLQRGGDRMISDLPSVVPTADCCCKQYNNHMVCL